MPAVWLRDGVTVPQAEAVEPHRRRAEFDAEAQKTVGLVRQLREERRYPRCDVFWNNQVLGTIALKAEGILLPYQGPGYERIPVGYKDPPVR